MVANRSTPGTFSENNKEPGQHLLEQGWRIMPKLLLVFSTKSPAEQYHVCSPTNLASLSGEQGVSTRPGNLQNTLFCLLSFPLDKIRCFGKMTC